MCSRSANQEMCAPKSAAKSNAGAANDRMSNAARVADTSLLAELDRNEALRDGSAAKEIVVDKQHRLEGENTGWGNADAHHRSPPAQQGLHSLAQKHDHPHGLVKSSWAG